jgi:hypothetical protein
MLKAHCHKHIKRCLRPIVLQIFLKTVGDMIFRLLPQSDALPTATLKIHVSKYGSADMNPFCSKKQNKKTNKQTNKQEGISSMILNLQRRNKASPAFMKGALMKQT